MDRKVYGIDLGTTYSAIATLDDNAIPFIIPNHNESSNTIASVVYFPADGDPVVGEQAKEMKMDEDERWRVVDCTKRYIGKPDAPEYAIDGAKYGPIEIAAIILKRIVKYAEDQGHIVKDVVITCPAYFGDEEMTATRQAGELAGLNVMKVVHEPTSATLNYCLREYKEPRKILVYDLGGGTFDITLSEFSVDESGKASIEVIRTAGNDRLGGIDFDERLFTYMCEQYAEENGIDTEDMDDSVKGTIRAQVEKAKKDLSGRLSKNYTIRDGSDRTRINITREEFNARCEDLVEQTMDFVDKLLEDTSCTPDDIDTVLLVGGSTLMPMISDAVKAKFPGDGKVLVEDPDLAVAKGAALAAAVEWNEIVRKAIEKSEEEGNDTVSLPGNDDKVSREEASGLMYNVPDQVKTVKDKLTRSLGPAVYTGDDRYMVDNLLFVGDEIPAEAEETYETRTDNAPSIIVHVYENVEEDRENRFVVPSRDPEGNPQYTDPELKVKHIGEVTLKLPPNTPKGSPIKVIFRTGNVGLEVTAVNVQTGEEATVTITSDNTKTKKEMEEAKKKIDKIETRADI